MKLHRVCGVIAIALCADTRAAWPQAAAEGDERVDRIVGAAMARGGAHAFLRTLIDSIGGRVTGSAESRAAADLLLATLRQAGFEDAHFEEYALASRWTRGPAAGRVVSPVDRPLAVGSYAWVPGTNGAVTAPLVDLGAPPGTAAMAAFAFRLADAPEAPGRRLSAAEAAELLRKLGLESLRRAVYEPDGPS